ncbi:MAG: response regulator [Bacteroidetes bacterium]|nr:response regulator [Bacteroidota bacterium]
MTGEDKDQQTLLNSGLRVLLVDDNKVNQFLGKRILSNLGIQCIDIAGSGEEALLKARNNHFDVMLTDVEMPGMNGYELSHQIRAEENAGSHLTIIALTANASDDDRENARAAGIDDYLTKPYSPQDLFDVLTKNTKLKRDFQYEKLEQEEIIGIAKVYAVFNHNENDVQQFLQMLRQQLPELINEVENGINESNHEKTYHAAHKLKSPVKLLTTSVFAQQFSDFTEGIRSQNDFKFAANQFEKLKINLDALILTINMEIEKKSNLS